MAAVAHARPGKDERTRAALWFAERGFRVFSVWSTTAAGVCHCPAGAACTSPGKHPITPNGFKDATDDAGAIRTMLAAASEPNYGLVCPDGVFALDVDGDGVKQLAALEVRYGALPATLRTSTAHGSHIFLRWPSAFPRPLGQLFGYVTRWGSGPAAGYVIGPRSVHASGAEYTPAGGTYEIAELPEVWAKAAIEEPLITIRGGTAAAGTIAVGHRHEYLRNRARQLRGAGLVGEALFAAVWSLNQQLAEPKAELEVRRAIGEVETRFGADPVDVVTPRSAAEIAAGSIDAADLLAEDIAALAWVVPDLLPEGTTVLAGPPKLGKSCLVYQIAVEVALGGALFDRAVDQGDVLYLALEDGKRRSQSRLRAALAGRTMPRQRLEVRWSAARLGEGLEAELTTWLDAHPNARLVAIDTLQRIRAPGDARRNAYEVDVEDLGRLQTIFRNRLVGLLIVHHTKKGVAEDFLASVSGTYGITGSADTTLVIQRTRLKAAGTLVAVGRDIPEAEVSVRFDGMVWSAIPTALAESSFERGEVYDVVERHGPIFATEVARLTGSSREAAQKLLGKLSDDGLIVRAQHGYIVAGIRIVEGAEGPTDEEVPGPGHSGHSGSRKSPYVGGTSSPLEGAEEPPTHARVGGGWLRPCRDFAAHQSHHRQTEAGWICDICEEEA